VDGHAVASPHDVQKLVWARDVGAALRVDVLRAGNKKTVIIPTAPPPE
jgi:S1-C subfamily serine protease